MKINVNLNPSNYMPSLCKGNTSIVLGVIGLIAYSIFQAYKYFCPSITTEAKYSKPDGLTKRQEEVAESLKRSLGNQEGIKSAGKIVFLSGKVPEPYCKWITSGQKCEHLTWSPSVFAKTFTQGQTREYMSKNFYDKKQPIVIEINNSEELFADVAAMSSFLCETGSCSNYRNVLFLFTSSVSLEEIRKKAKGKDFVSRVQYHVSFSSNVASKVE